MLMTSQPNRDVTARTDTVPSPALRLSACAQRLGRRLLKDVGG